MACNCKNKKIGNPNITCFVDCATEHAVIRVPYNLLIDLLKNCRKRGRRDDLIRVIYSDLSRRKKLRNMLYDNQIGVE